MKDVPTYEFDIFDEAARLDPFEHYRALRDLGPLVWLERHEVYALPRYAEVRSALADADTYRSGEGVGMNEMSNHATKGTTLASDGDLHAHLRGVLTKELTPRALRPRRAGIDALARKTVAAVVARGSFDAVTDLARALPLSVVPDMVGWPAGGRDHLLQWAAGAFDLLGPMNERAEAALPHVMAMGAFAARTAADGAFLPGGLGAGILAAAERGDLLPTEVPGLVIDFIAPSLDTTISAIGNAVWLLGTHPDQWAALRADRSLIPNAVNEVVRLESPIRSFSRVTSKGTDIGDFHLPAGSRVLMMFASANRDERHWKRPDEFDITRDAAAHVGFGYGSHGCAGQGLARIETQAVLSALADQVDTIEVGEPVRGGNNLIRALASLPVTVTPAPAAGAAQ